MALGGRAEPEVRTRAAAPALEPLLATATKRATAAKQAAAGKPVAAGRAAAAKRAAAGKPAAAGKRAAAASRSSGTPNAPKQRPPEAHLTAPGRGRTPCPLSRPEAKLPGLASFSPHSGARESLAKTPNLAGGHAEAPGHGVHPVRVSLSLDKRIGDVATRRRKSKSANPKRPKTALQAEDTSGSESTDQEEAEAGEPGEDELAGELLEDGVALADPVPDVGDERIFKRSSAASGASETGLARIDTLQAYMREVQQHPLLTPAEEHELAVEYQQTGDLEAAARLVTANLRLVVKIAYEYRRAYRNMMDLIQEGNIGLMQAVKRYDPYRGVKLSSYSAWWIRAYMLRFILNNWRMVKIGTTQAQRKLFFNLSKEKAKLTAMGIEPTHEEIAKRLNVDEKDVVEMDRRLARSDASLDAPVNETDGRTASRVELLPSAATGPDTVAEETELAELVRERLEEFRKTLTGKDIHIFDKRLVAEDPMTLQQLGDEFGVSRERVRQLEARLAGKLREYLKSTLGEAVEVG